MNFIIKDIVLGHKMIYRDEKIVDILLKGEYKEYKWIIVSYGTHPCAYIKLHNDSKLISLREDIPINCHGGITYFSSDGIPQLKAIPKKDNEIYLYEPVFNSGYFIGWNYAHADDQIGSIENKWKKKWTESDIQLEVYDVIEQLIVLEQEENN